MNLNRMPPARMAESVSMLMIGDGVLGMVMPAEHCLTWRGGPAWWRNAVDWFAAHPQITRSAAVAEIAAGVWLALLRRQPLSSRDLESAVIRHNADTPSLTRS
jgi:hypothetical protein